MELFLKILGGVVLSIAILIFSFYIYLKIKFGRLPKLDPDDFPTPLKIHLNQDFTPVWHQSKKTQSAIEELRTLGFSQGHSYQIKEIPQIKLTAFFKPPYACVLYQQELMGNWVDLVIDEVNGTEYTFTNAPMGEKMDYRPGKVVKNYKNSSISDVYDAAVSATKAHLKNTIKVEQDNFRAYFENAYMKDMTYKASIGGITFEEFLATGLETKIQLSEEQTTLAFIDQKHDELHQWHEAAMKDYIESSNLEDHQENDFYDTYQYLIVPYKTHPSAFVRYLGDLMFVEGDSEELEEYFKDDTGIDELFEKLNLSKSKELRAEFVTDYHFPLKLKIYRFKY